MATPAPALLPEWGSGHLMSMLESCKRVFLASGGGREFSITLLVMRPPTDEASSEVEAHVRREAASGLDIRFHHLPAVEPRALATAAAASRTPSPPRARPRRFGFARTHAGTDAFGLLDTDSALSIPSGYKVVKKMIIEIWRGQLDEMKGILGIGMYCE